MMRMVQGNNLFMTVCASQSMYLRGSRRCGKHSFPIGLHVGHEPTIELSLVQCLVELTAKNVVAIVRELSIGISVMDEQTERRSLINAADCRPDEHLAIAIGVSETGDWTPADVLVDVDGFACFVVKKVERPFTR